MSAALRTAMRRAAAVSETTLSVARSRAAPVLLRASPVPVARVATPSAAVRSFSTSPVSFKVKRDAWASNPTIGYDEVKKLSDQPNDDVLLIDTREPDEVINGTIPSAVILPLSRLEAALNPKFNPGDFQREFAFAKPLPEQNIVFFCRSGRRSGLACEIAEREGYPNVRNYVGSWLEWEDKSKKEGNDDW
ncbi:Thiosulfate sulfurtransferase rdl2, mitochondrial [Vanrija albida]|uniref:Thiosulfate sulfurtransferase rdl2, mitochondrial n=1 Tax=Vanrija albida TaxID=181172 RepID=A0ABR3PZ59_9TREE